MSPDLIFLRVNRGYAVNPRHMDLLLTPAGLGDVVGGLYRISVSIFIPRAFSMRSAISPEVGLAVKQAGQRAPGNLKRGPGYRQARRIDNLRPMKSPGWGGFFMGMEFSSFCPVVVFQI